VSQVWANGEPSLNSWTRLRRGRFSRRCNIYWTCQNSSPIFEPCIWTNIWAKYLSQLFEPIFVHICGPRPPLYVQLSQCVSQVVESWGLHSWTRLRRGRFSRRCDICWTCQNSSPIFEPCIWANIWAKYLSQLFEPGIWAKSNSNWKRNSNPSETQPQTQNHSCPNSNTHGVYGNAHSMLFTFRIKLSHILASQLLLYKPSDMPTVLSTLRRATMPRLTPVVEMAVDFGPEVGIGVLRNQQLPTDINATCFSLLWMGHGTHSSSHASAASSFSGQTGFLDPALLVHVLCATRCSSRAQDLTIASESSSNVQAAWWYIIVLRNVKHFIGPNTWWFASCSNECLPEHAQTILCVYVACAVWVLVRVRVWVSVLVWGWILLWVLVWVYVCVEGGSEFVLEFDLFLQVLDSDLQNHMVCTCLCLMGLLNLRRRVHPLPPLRVQDVLCCSLRFASHVAAHAFACPAPSPRILDSMSDSARGALLLWLSWDRPHPGLQHLTTPCPLSLSEWGRLQNRLWDGVEGVGIEEMVLGGGSFSIAGGHGHPEPFA